MRDEKPDPDTFIITSVFDPETMQVTVDARCPGDSPEVNIETKIAAFRYLCEELTMDVAGLVGGRDYKLAQEVAAAVAPHAVNVAVSLRLTLADMNKKITEN